MNIRKIIITALAIILSVSLCSARKIKSITASDIVLLYAGGQIGNYVDQEYVSDYVSYVDRNGKEQWLFDGFLLLQIWDKGNNSSEVAFTPGMKGSDGKYLQAANQADWKKLIDYYFAEGECIDAIDKAIDDASKRIGKPDYKRQIIISIPDPMPYKEPIDKLGGTTYWGLVKGEVTDFSKEEDRAKACKWFIDEVLRTYKSKKYKHVELAGFYWITEQFNDKSTLLPEVCQYVHAKGLPITWIPYFQAPGYTEWKDKGFDLAWYQPNYFFYNVPESQLKKACEQAVKNGMAMEMEFDERAKVVPEWGNISLAYKLRAYMDAFRKYGPWEKCQLAYYQSSKAVRALKMSSESKDIELYQDLCDFIAKRPYRTNKQF